MLPGVAQAQTSASINGVVRDTQGGVVPGVTVEAASPALIEKVRSSITDGAGRYAIANLRPGTYTMTFTLTGFATVKREGVVLTGTATVAVDAEMRVGTVAETVTVSGETPLVDVQTTRRQTVLDQQTVTAIPTSRNSFSVGVLIPGVTLAFSVRWVRPTTRRMWAARSGRALSRWLLMVAACRISGRRSTASR